MSATLDPGVFEGTVAPPPAPVVNGGRSTYAGCIAAALLDRAAVAPVVPAGFQLATRSDGGSTHPVLCMVGHQRHPTLVLGGHPTPAPDPGYQEMIVLVPFVVRQAGGVLHSLVLRMYLDDMAALWIGNTYYDYAKRFAVLPESGTAGHLTTTVMPILDGVVFRCHFQQTGGWTSAASGAAPPAWQAFATVFAMPLLGTDGQAVPPVCSSWGWDATAAQVAPATSVLRLEQPCADHTAPWTGAPLPVADQGAFLLRGMRWDLADPPLQPCAW